ncbi:MAG: type II toxin-antitoxin system RelE/ParE family toxin [Elusimicrobiota bacterium]
MKYELKIKHSAEKELNKIPLNAYERISKHIFLLAEKPYPKGCMKLREGIYRIRIGNYRVVYSVDKKNAGLTIIKVGHRKEVYK